MNKILVVDDEIKTCELLKRYLETKGYDVIISNSGEDALKKVKNEKPDIILLDMKMPGMDGMEVLRRVRAFDKDVGIIMITVVKDEEIGKEALKAGADKYIRKPVDLDYLETCVFAGLTMEKR